MAKEMQRQLTFADTSDEYEEFVGKFKPKKTTDDCYTPENVYEAVKGWVVQEYGIDESGIERPFWPGGDYERFAYEEGGTVLDNPPFSIITPIINFYLDNGIRFFLFAPTLTNFNSGKANVCHVVAGAEVTYENGAEINTSFVTNLDDCAARSAPGLRDAIERANKENLKNIKKQLPKYSYPPEVLRASDLSYMSNHGTEFKVAKGECCFVRALDSQKALKKAIFGGGFLLSEHAAAERMAAECSVRGEIPTCWGLSERERMIVKSLGGDKITRPRQTPPEAPENDFAILMRECSKKYYNLQSEPSYAI